MRLLQWVLFLVTINIIFAEKYKGKRRSKSERIFRNDTNPEVQLKNGLRLIGRRDTTEANNTYYSFRGIPFAKPPIGELKFKFFRNGILVCQVSSGKHVSIIDGQGTGIFSNTQHDSRASGLLSPPVPLTETYNGKTLNAQEDASSCAQAAGITVVGSEDCLYINVYTPKFPKRINLLLLPVIVWVYGGDFLFGTSKYDMFGSDLFMDQGGVIIVTFNYRLGILGWLSTEDDACPGNNGLKDQILALKWVNENIRSFGGNPDQVTIFGESAGAASIGYLVQTPLTKGLYHGAILLSGTSVSPWSFIRNPRAVALAAAKVLNINATNSEALVNGLRKVNYTTLVTVQTVMIFTTPLLGNPYNGFLFGPVVEPPNSGAAVTRTSYGLLANGLFQHVPYLLGFTSLEGIALIPVFEYFISIFGPQSLAPASMMIYDPVVLNQTNAEIMKHYFGPPPGDYSQTNNAQYFSDNEFVRPTLKTASLYSQQQPPVYLCNFSYQGYLGSGDRVYQGPGVGHGEDLVYYWKIASNPRTPTASDLITQKRMITYLTNFARAGNPTPTTDPILQNTRWPRTTAAGNGNLAYMNIGDNLVTGVNPSWDQYQWWNALFAKYGNSPYDTY